MVVLLSDKRERISGIYCIVNIVNNKRYIGQSKDILNRFIHHKSDLKASRHRNRHLQRAYNKYGMENFKYIILEECALNVIDEREVFWIDFYQSQNTSFGYNFQSGGHENHTASEETRALLSQRISEVQQGRKLTPEWKENIRKARLGTKRSEETKRKLSESKRGVSNINSGNFQKGQTPWNKGLSLSIETRNKISNALLNSSNTNRVEATQEMIEDVKNGITRRTFEEKYGHQSVWYRIRKEVIA